MMRRQSRKRSFVSRLFSTDSKFEIGSTLEFHGATELEPRILLDGAIDDPLDVNTIDVDQFSTAEYAEVSALSVDAGSGSELLFFADFEDVDVASGGYDFFQQVSGFTATRSAVEVQDNHSSVGPGSRGSQLLELDGVNGVQVELDTSSSAQLTLYFDYSARPRVAGNQNAIEVWWNGELLDTIVDDGKRLKTTDFREIRLALGSTNTDTSLLEFRSNSPDDIIGRGGLIDNVRVFRELGPLSLAPIEDQVLAPGEQLSITAMLVGNEIVDGLTYSILSGPEGISINPETGEIEWFASQANIDASDASNDRIVRGDEGLLFQTGFEDVVVAPGGYGFFGQVSGFTATGAPVEIQNNHPSVGVPSEGQNNLELDGTSGIFRIIETTGLDEFELMVDYSPRPGVNAASNAIQIWWGGQLIATLSEDGSRKKRTAFETYRFSLPTHSSDQTRLEFRSIDPADTVGLGGLLDNINVFRTPVTQVEGEDGKYKVIVQVADPAGRTDQESFTVCVEESGENRAPELEPIPDLSTNEGATLEYQVYATDFENQVLTYSLSPGGHGGASIDPTTGLFRFETSEAEGPGQYVFEVNVSDGELTAQASFLVTVNEVNLAPELIVPTEVIDGSLTLDLRSTLSLDFDATDSDTPENQLLFSLEEYVAGAQIDPDTGVFTFFPTIAMVGQSFDFNVIVRDNGFPVLSDNHRFSIDVSSCPFDDALTNWTVQENGGSDGQMGHVVATDCQAVITEGDSFVVTLSTSFIVQQNKAIQFSYSDLNFDTTDEAFINDAFEVALLGPNGQSLIDTFADGRDAFFNISEGLPAVTGDGIVVDGETITVGLNGLAVGTAATLIFRLVNDDSDTTTSVKVTDFVIVDSFAKASRFISAPALASNSTTLTPEPQTHLVTSTPLFSPDFPATSTTIGNSSNQQTENGHENGNNAVAQPLTFVGVSTDFNSPIGIDHHEPSNSIIVSVNYPTGQPHSLERINPDGSNEPFSDLAGLTNEVKIATVRSTGFGGFTVGDLFVGNGIDGQIVRITDNGETVINPWVDLPGAGNGLLRGSLYVDETGVFDGDLIAVTTAGEVWRIASDATTTLVATTGVHLEGLAVVPNEFDRYGPLAGKIISGAEEQGLLYAFDADGTFDTYDLGVEVEDIELIPKNENFYGVNFGTQKILAVPSGGFNAYAGGILLTQESSFEKSGLFHLYWNGQNLVADEIEISNQTTETIGQWEHVTFSRSGIAEVSAADPPVIVAKAPRHNIPAGQQVVLSGEAIANGFLPSGELNRIDFVTVNGQPVDQLDRTGKFFVAVDLLPGENEYIFEATDAFGQTTQALLTVVGTQNESEINFNQFADITQSIDGVYSRTSFDERNTTLFVELVAANLGTFPANGPLLVGVKNISDLSVSLLGFDGFTPDGIPYFDFTEYLTSNSLESGSQSEIGTIEFFNPLEVQFDYELVFLAQVNGPPEITSLPVIEAYFDETYVYDVQATDPNDDELTYALTITSPGMTIDAATGVITWSPTINDYGLHDIAIKVTDGRGGKAEQRFTLHVTEAPPNRPPIIVSTPVTSAALPASTQNQAFPFDQMRLNGDAELVSTDLDGEVIRLVSVIENQAGTAFSETQRNANEFSAAFTFRISETGGRLTPPGSDGLSFFIHTDNSVVGLIGGGIGYASIENSVGVEFDIFQNIVADTSSNHVAIVTDGNPHHLPGEAVDVAPNFDNAELWYAWADYNGTTLEVRLSQSAERPRGPILTRVLDIPDILGSDTAYFGFTAATGANWANHDIIEWRFNDQFSPFDNNGIGSYVIDWQTDAINISNSTEPSLSPTIAVDQDGKLHLAYREGPDRGFSWYENMIYTSLEVDGTFRVAPVNLDAPGWNGAASLVIDDENRPVIAWHALNVAPGEEVLMTTLDENGLASGFVQITDTPSRTNTDLPRLVVGNGGEIFFVWQDEVNDPIDGDQNRRRDLFFQKLKFEGTGYVLDGDPIEFTSSEGIGFGNVGYVNNFGDIAVDQVNNLHVVWADWRDSIDSNQTEVYYEVLSSGGTTIVDEVRLSTLGGPAATRPQLEIDSNGNAHVLWIEKRDEIDALVHAIVNTTGEVVSTQELFVGDTDSVTSFSFTIDEFDQLHVLRSDATGEKNVVSYHRFNVAGDLLVDNLQVSESDAVVSFNAQYPAIAVSGKDTFSIVWDELSDDETSDVFFKSFTVRSTAVVTYRYEVQAIDADDDQLTYALNEAPRGMTINPNSGVILWSPARSQEGNHDVTVRVADGNGGIAEQSYIVCVHEDLTTEIRQVITSFEGEFENRLVNDAPTITSVPRVNAIQGEQYLYNAVANDVNGDPIQWNLDSAPVGMTIDSDTGEIQWTPTGEQLGNYLVVLSAYDSIGASATQRFQVHVGCNNLPPAIVSVPPTAALTQRDYFYAVRARDVEGDTLTWSLQSAPAGMTINANSGFIRWQPAVGQIGPHEIIVNVSDGNSTARQSYTVVVSSADDLIDPNDPTRGPKGNRAPLITSTPNFGATVDLLYQYQVEAVDLDGHAISYALVGTAPAGMTVDANGLLTWTPATDAVGDVAVNVQAIDEFGAIASQGFILTVATNSAPVIDSTPPPSVVEGRTYRYTINAIDADGDELDYQLVTGPAGMTIDSQIGYITWSTFDHPVAAGTTVDVSVRVTDSFGNEVTQNWQIDVIEDTVAPVVSLTVISPAGVFFGEEAEFNIGRPYSVQVLARDNARITERSLSIDGVDIPLDGRGIAVITPTQSGLFTLVATATDSAGLTATATTTVNLLNQAPEIISKPPVFAAANEDFVYQVIASDAEGHSVTYSLTTGPAGATIDGLSGEFTIAAADFAPGNYELTVRATDEYGAFSQQSINFAAIDLSINHAPIFLTQPPTVIPAGLFYFYLPQTLDYNGDTVTYSLLEGSAEFKEETGRLRFRAPFTTGDLDFVIQADDGNGGITTQEFTVAVTPANRAPVFISQPTVRVQAGALYAYAPVISDPNGDNFVLYNREGPRERKPGDFFSSWSIDIGDDNVIRWQTDLGDIGSYTVTLGAQDEWGEWGYQTFTLDVVEELTAPLVEVVATPNPAEVGDLINVQVLAFDDGTIESLSLTFEGQTIELDAQGRGSFTTTATGHYELVAVAIDNDGNSTERTVPLQVRDLSDMQAPVVSIASPVRDSVVTSFTDIVGSVADQNLLYYSLSYAPLSGGPFVEFYRSDQTVNNDVLGEFDPTTVANDSYRIRLFAKDVNNRTSIAETVVEVMGELKIGNFTLSFSDMTIPIGGIPIIVGRTYDSLNANQQGEFGYGWRLEFRDVDLRTSVAPSGQENIGFYRPFKDGSRVYLTLPGGKREGFTFEVERAGGLRGALGMHFGTFKPDAGVRTQLTVPKFELAFDSDANVYTWGSGQAYNPANSIFGGKYYATTEAGVLFEIDGDTGDLERVIDANANVITYTDEAIVSSSGQRVDFIRDDRGRIVRAIDPEGNAIVYAYDDQGDLISVTDREGNVTQFNYDAPRPHYLSEIIDPLGRTGIRTEYDETGKLVRMFDANGNMTQLIHDPDNFVEQIVDPLGNTTTFEYDVRGNVLREIDALGGVTTTTYDIENNELTITDPLGNMTEMTYSETSDLLTTTDPLGNVTTKTYDRLQPRISLGNGLSFAGFVKPFSVETSTTDAVGNVSQMGYDLQGNLTSMTNAAGEVNTFVLDATGAPMSVSRAGTTPQTFSYDSAGNLTESVDAFGNRTLVTYDGNGEILTETSFQTLENGSTRTLMTQNEYDREGRIRFVRNYEDGVLLTENEFRFNAVGKQVERIDTLGRSTKFVYDERGLLVETIYPDTTPGDESDNPRTRTEYDVLGRSTARIDELGRRTEYVYDGLGRLTTTIFADATPNDSADNPRTETVYDAAGRTIAQIDELGNRTETIYNEAGRAIFSVLPDDTPDDATDNPRFETVYDAAGRSVEQIDPLGNVTRFEYEDGRAVRTIFADGTSTENIYNDIGIVVASVDQNDIRTDYEYNDQGQLLAVISAEVVNPATGLTERPRTEYEYDVRGNLLVQRDALGKETVYEYDSRNRRISATLPMGQTSTTEFDVHGRTIASTDFNGDVTTYEYDIRNRLVSKTFADDTGVSTSYSANGLVETLTDSRGVTSYTYDQRSRLTLQVNPDATSLAYTYDAAGNRTSLTVPSGTTTYTYDARNRISSVTDQDGDVTSYEYNALSLVSTTFANGTVESRLYDALNRLTYLENSGPGGVINSFTYSMDGAGNRTGVVEADGRRVDYSYDNLYRLTSEAITDSVNGDRTLAYVYDIVGNRLERDDSVDGVTSYVYDANDRLVTETTGSQISEYVYDTNGNTLTKSVNGVLAAAYQWNFENRLVAADTDGDGTIDVTYQYDASGNRVSKTENGETTNYLVDSALQYPQVVEEYTDGGVIKVSYVYGRDLISQNRPAETGKSIYHIDGLGSTRALTDSSGVVTDRYIYDAFGRTIAQIGSTGNVYLFAGEQRDFALGLDYLRARYLNPATGRFVSRDPAPSRPNMPLTANRYSYVENNAVNLIDPSGLLSLLEVATAIAIGGIIANAGLSLFAFALSDRIVESNLLVATVSRGSLIATIYIAKSEPVRQYSQGLLVYGVLLGGGYQQTFDPVDWEENPAGASVSFEFSSDTAYSPGIFFNSPRGARAAFAGVFDLASAGISFGASSSIAGGNASQGLGGGFIGMSVVDQSGLGFGGSSGSSGGLSIELSAGVFAGISIPFGYGDCRTDLPLLCSLAEANFGGFSNQQILGLFGIHFFD